MAQPKMVSFSGWSIALALASILSGDDHSSKLVRDFYRDSDLDRIFSNPAYDPPDPTRILPPHLVHWATSEE
jgi:hypothetical protein